MDDADDFATPPFSTLRPRNPIRTQTTFTAATNHHSSSSATPSSSATSSSCSSSSSVDFELVSIKPTCYTSLRDILPSTGTFVQSPKAPSSAANSASEISIRNPLVKQAAWAYLQPMSTSTESDDSTFFYRIWTRFCDAFIRLTTQAFDCLLRAIQLPAT